MRPESPKTRHTKLSRQSFWCDWAGEVSWLVKLGSDFFCKRCHQKLGENGNSTATITGLPVAGKLRESTDYRASPSYSN